MQFEHNRGFVDWLTDVDTNRPRSEWWFSRSAVYAKLGVGLFPDYPDDPEMAWPEGGNQQSCEEEDESTLRLCLPDGDTVMWDDLPMFAQILSPDRCHSQAGPLFGAFREGVMAQFAVMIMTPELARDSGSHIGKVMHPGA